MIEYENLAPKQKKLFNKLADAIEKNANANDNAQDILKNADSEDIQAVLNTLFCTLGEQTLLIRAIKFNDTEIAEAILEKAAENQDVLTNLLSKESIINGNSRTAFEYAKEKGYTDLAKKIKAKMDKLGIPDKEAKLIESDESLGPFIDTDDRSLWFPREGNTKRAEENKRKMDELLKKDSESLGSPIDNRDENFTIRRASNNLFWAVLWRKGEVVKNILKNSRNQGDTAQILKVGLIRLCIGGKRAEALATKGNDKIIRNIKTGQALVINLIGLTMVFLAAVIVLIALIPPELTAGSITGIVIAGFMVAVGGAGVGFAIFHDSYKIPNSKIEGVGTNKPPAQVQGPC